MLKNFKFLRSSNEQNSLGDKKNFTVYNDNEKHDFITVEMRVNTFKVYISKSRFFF